jgi:isopropylmalate/homocitrate/citramalate synthase
VGIGTPKLIRQKVRVAKQSTNIPIGLHCHDDFGLAIINSLTGIEAGGEFISSTFNRIGERAGNASTECCVCALELLYGYKTNLRLSRLSEVAQMVSRYSGIGIPPNAPIVGSNAFRHESGIHVSAMLRDPRCYEAFDPSLFGAKRQFVLGKTSGRAGLRHFAAAEGVDLPDDLCDIILHRVKEMCDSEMGLQEGALRKLLQETVSLNSVASSTSS